MAGKTLNLVLQMVDAFSDAAAVCFELRFTGASAANAAAQAREARSLTGETGKQIAELRQLDLHLAFSAMRPLRKDVENQLGPIDHRQVGNLRNLAHLSRRQILIKNEKVCAFLHGVHEHVFELAASQLKPVLTAVRALH